MNPSSTDKTEDENPPWDFPEDVFREAEAAMGFKVPVALENILRINGFDNNKAIRELTDNDISAIEKFSRETVSRLIPKDEYPEYFGRFANNITSFVLVPGHKKLVFDLVKHCQEKYKTFLKAKTSAKTLERQSLRQNQEQTRHFARSGTQRQNKLVPNLVNNSKDSETSYNDRNNNSPSNTPINTSKSSELTFSTYPQSQEMQHGQIDDRKTGSTEGLSHPHTKEIDLTKENKWVFKALRKWIKEKCVNKQQWLYLRVQIKEFDINSRLSSIPGKLECSIKCFCNATTKISKLRRSETCQSRWIYSNFHKHFLKHFSSADLTSDRASTKSANKASRKKQSGILDFFHAASEDPSHSIVNPKSRKTVDQNQTHHATSREVNEMSSEYESDSNSEYESKYEHKPLNLRNPEEVRQNQGENRSESRQRSPTLSATEIMSNVPISTPMKTEIRTEAHTKPDIDLDQEPDSKPMDGKLRILQDVVVFPAITCKLFTTPLSPHLPSTFDTDLIPGPKSISNTREETKTNDLVEDENHMDLDFNYRVENSFENCEKKPPTSQPRDTHISKSGSKWKSVKYSRKERKRRRREKGVDDSQPLITTYYEFMNQVQDILDTNPDISKVFQPNVLVQTEKCSTSQNDDNSSTQNANSLLKLLMDMSIRNSTCSTNKSRYHDTITQFSIYLYYIGGRLLYETLQTNLKGAIPSISALNRHIEKVRKKLGEGEFDYTGLNFFLEERKLPKYIWISEDATRITGKIEYDPKTNKIIGFVLPLKNGFPQTETYVACSSAMIERYFQTSPKSDYAYVIMAQSLSGVAPAYCLSIYGTDNKFCYKDVTTRWETMTKELTKQGITVLGYSADGDTRLLKAMRCVSSLPPSVQQSVNDWSWFQSSFDLDITESCVQDTVHIGTKLRTRFLKSFENSKKCLIMGRYCAKVDDLHLLIQRFPKEEHLLTMSDLNSEDKMNFKSAEKMCTDKVRNLLNEIPETGGTIEYLKIMKYTIASYLDKGMTILERVYHIWYCVFFIRVWRQWILDSPEYKLSENFLTSNAYLCIELNAHALIRIIRIFAKNNFNPSMFMPWLFSSQACEQIFRSLRSMTSTNSTIVNFSLRDIMARIDRIKVVNNLIHDLDGTIIFPREEKKKYRGTRTMSPRNSQSNDHSLINISDDDINHTVQQALSDALSTANKLGINPRGDSHNHLNIPLRLDHDESVTGDAEDLAEDESKIDDKTSHVDEDVAQANIFGNIVNTVMNDDSDIPDSEDNEGISNLDGAVNIESRENLSPKNPASRFVTAVVGGKSKVIKKSTLCWMLETSKERVSTDRLKRFHKSKQSSTTISTKGLKKTWKGTKTGNRNVIETASKNIKRNSKVGKRGKRKVSSSSAESEAESEDFEIDSDRDSDNVVEDKYSSDEPEDEPLENMEYEKSQDCSPKYSPIPEMIPGSFHAVYYDQGWYIGIIIQIADIKEPQEKKSHRMKFLKRNLSTLYWPREDDIDEVDEEFIFHGPIELKANEVGSLSFELEKANLANIDKKYKLMKKKFKN